MNKYPLALKNVKKEKRRVGLKKGIASDNPSNKSLNKMYKKVRLPQIINPYKYTVWTDRPNIVHSTPPLCKMIDAVPTMYYEPYRKKFHFFDKIPFYV